MNEPILHLTPSQLNEFARQAGLVGAEYAYERLSAQTQMVARMVEQSGAHKSVLSAREAATYAGVEVGTVRRWIRDGMPAAKVGGRAGFQIRKVDLDDWRMHRSQPSAGEQAVPDPNGLSVEGPEGV